MNFYKVFISSLLLTATVLLQAQQALAVNKYLDELGSDLRVLSSGDYQIRSYPFHLIGKDDKIIDLGKYSENLPAKITGLIIIENLLENIPKGGELLINAVEVISNKQRNLFFITQYHFLDSTGEYQYIIDENINYKFDSDESSNPNKFKNNGFHDISHTSRKLNFGIEIPQIYTADSGINLTSNIEKRKLLNYQKRKEFKEFQLTDPSKIHYGLTFGYDLGFDGESRFNFSSADGQFVNHRYNYNTGSVIIGAFLKFKSNLLKFELMNYRLEPGDYAVFQGNSSNTISDFGRPNQFISRNDLGYGFGYEYNMNIATGFSVSAGISYLKYRINPDYLLSTYLKDNYIIRPNIGVIIKPSTSVNGSFIIKISQNYHQFDITENGKNFFVKNFEEDYKLVKKNKQNVSFSIGFRYQIR